MIPELVWQRQANYKRQYHKDDHVGELEFERYEIFDMVRAAELKGNEDNQIPNRQISITCTSTESFFHQRGYLYKRCRSTLL